MNTFQEAKSKIEPLIKCLVEAWKSRTNWNAMELTDRNGVLWVNTEIDHPFFNNVIIYNHNEFQNKGLGIVSTEYLCRPRTWWHLNEKGNRDNPMLNECNVREIKVFDQVLNLQGKDRQVAQPSDLEIIEVSDKKELVLWLNVFSQAFRFPGFASDALSKMHLSTGFIYPSPWRHFVALTGLQPVAIATLFYKFEIGLISSIATIDKKRLHGFGRAIVAHTLAAAAALGVKQIGLFCPEHELPFYEKMGFATGIGRILKVVY